MIIRKSKTSLLKALRSLSVIQPELREIYSAIKAASQQTQNLGRILASGPHIISEIRYSMLVIVAIESGKWARIAPGTIYGLKICFAQRLRH